MGTGSLIFISLLINSKIFQVFGPAFHDLFLPSYFLAMVISIYGGAIAGGIAFQIVCILLFFGITYLLLRILFAIIRRVKKI
jgi:hypothetical protein